MPNLTLHVGVDESNHHSTRDEEVIVTVFSFDARDGKTRIVPARAPRDYGLLKKWMSFKGRDYRFTAIPNDLNNRRTNSLIIAAPYLLQDFLRTEAERIPQISLVSMHLDGRLYEHEIKILGGRCSEVCRTPFNIFCYPKGKTPGVEINYPYIVEAADVMANKLYRQLKRSYNRRHNGPDPRNNAEFVNIFP